MRYLISAILDWVGGENVVITAYRTSKIEKYWSTA